MFFARHEDGVVVQVVKADSMPDPWVPSAERISVGWTYSDGVFTAPPGPTPEEILAASRAAMVCSPVQMRLALAGAGMLTEVNAAAAADPSAAVVWEYATSIYRNSAFIASLAAGFTNPNTDELITAEEIDALFVAAMAIEP